MYGRWRDDDRFRDDRDRDRDRDRDADRRTREREFGGYDQDRYGYGRQDRYGRGGAFGGDYERSDYGRDYDRGRDYDYGRGGGFERERRFGGERGYSRGQGWRADEHPGYARNAYRPEPRSFWERSRDEVGSWFGDEDADAAAPAGRDP